MEKLALVAAVEGSSVITPERVSARLHKTRAYLLSQRKAEGYWEGRLSSSALATATALSALSLAADAADKALISKARKWLSQDQNHDGGWGDSPESPSNLSTTLLCLAALILATANDGNGHQAMVGRAWDYVKTHAGQEPEAIAATIQGIYGTDRTFAVPILMNCALAGLVSWSDVPSLPFELAACPQALYRVLHLEVVSYALPALIAVGFVIDRHHPSTLSPLRHVLKPLLLRKLAAIQPVNGGFLEATPLTAFTAMSLIAASGAEQPVAQRCLEFIRSAVRPDGSWPIDTNLATWVTTSAVNALLAGPSAEIPELMTTCNWVVTQQFNVKHPYTGAAPGGFAWTYLPGAVPDADDTSGALLMLQQVAKLGMVIDETIIERGTQWLLGLQNVDGGWPTFCRGWGHLPFDQSCPDITAHALRALKMTEASLPARQRGLAYLERTQRPDGSWLPLWFGNQQTTSHSNPVLGTARVILALTSEPEAATMLNQALNYLCQAQNADGGWGGDRGISSSVEETALALGALAAAVAPHEVLDLWQALEHGLDYLEHRLDDESWMQPAPIGLYFASLWYSERLYPVIWTVEALERIWGLVKSSKNSI